MFRQRCDLLVVVAGLPQHLFGVLAQKRWRKAVFCSLAVEGERECGELEVRDAWMLDRLEKTRRVSVPEHVVKGA